MCTVDAVHLIVSGNRNLKETTIRTLLRRLEHQGYLTQESDGRAYVYGAVERLVAWQLALCGKLS